MKRASLLLASFGVSTPAAAYVLLAGSWAWQAEPVHEPLYFAADSFPTSVASADAWEASFLAAIDTWNTTSDADVHLTYGGRTKAGLAPDGVLVAAYVEGPDENVAEALAVASSWYDGGAAKGTPASQFDCDIKFYSRTASGPIDWHVGGASAQSSDFQEVATHELGHCLGLGHSGNSSAIMWFAAHNIRALHADDLAGVEEIYGPSCADGDGDGYACDDCDDGDADVHPGASETCNGVDDDCDGGVDSATSVSAEFGGDAQGLSADRAALTGLFRADRDQLLEAFAQDVTIAKTQRVHFTVYESAAADQPFDLVGLASTDESAMSGPLSSPPLHVPLVAGRYYMIGVVGEGEITFAYKQDTAPPSVEGVQSLGSGVLFAAPALTIAPPAVDKFPPHQTLFLRREDADGDGVTDLCGDCDDAEAAVAPGTPEACDGLDNNCDTLVDEGLPDDDADAVADCVDPCPGDAANDADGDGACTADDPCPDDPDDACAAGDTGGGGLLGPDCGCATPVGAPWAALWLLPWALRRRRA